MRHSLLALMAVALAASAALPARASTFAVSGSGSTFTISRSGDTSAAETARGYFNNWANDCPLTRPEGGNYYSGTLQAHAGGSSGLKFDLDGNWGSSTWGGTSASAATVN